MIEKKRIIDKYYKMRIKLITQFFIGSIMEIIFITISGIFSDDLIFNYNFSDNFYSGGKKAKHKNDSFIICNIHIKGLPIRTFFDSRKNFLILQPGFDDCVQFLF